MASSLEGQVLDYWRFSFNGCQSPTYRLAVPGVVWFDAPRCRLSFGPVSNSGLSSVSGPIVIGWSSVSMGGNSGRSPQSAKNVFIHFAFLLTFLGPRVLPSPSLLPYPLHRGITMWLIVFLQTLVAYFPPNRVNCSLRVWLREIGFSFAYGALMLKTWR